MLSENDDKQPPKKETTEEIMPEVEVGSNRNFVIEKKSFTLGPANNLKDDKLSKKQLKIQANKMRIITIKDVEQLPFEERFIYDNRNIFKYTWDNIRIDHKLFSIFFKTSLVSPYYIRIISTFTVMSFMICMNAILYKDSDIKKRYEMDTKYKVRFIY